MSGDIHQGIMLCERPAASGASAGLDLPAFRPSCTTQALDPLGITPVKKTTEYNSPRPIGVTQRHRDWVRTYEAEIRAEKERQAVAAADTASKHQSLKNFSSKLRAAILKGEGVSDFWKPVATKRMTAATTSGQEAYGTNMDAESLLQDVDDFVNSLFPEPSTAAPAQNVAPSIPEPQRPVSQPAPSEAPRPSSSQSKADGSASKKKKGPSKPAWAFTQDDVAALEADEEQDLLQFVDGLDFDGFVNQLDDVELKDTFKAMEEAERASTPDDKAWKRNFVRAMNHVTLKHVQQQAEQARAEGGDDEGSVAGQSEAPSVASRATHASQAKLEAARSKLASIAERSAAAKAGGWESSSMAADDVARMERLANKTREAEELLRENPELRAVHSSASVRTMLVKAEGVAV